MNNRGLIITASSLLVVIIGLSMYIAWWADDAAYKKAVQANTIREYKAFLNRYPNSEFAADVQKRYDELDYRKARKSHTEGAYNEYLREHPHSLYADSVKIFVDDLAFVRVKASNDVSVCRQYLNEHPNSRHAAAVLKKIDGMEKEYYNSKINIAIDRVYRYDIDEYYRLFPSGKYAQKVAAKSKDLRDYEAYKSAKSSDTKYAWQQYLQNYPDGKYRSQANAKIREYEEREYYLNYSLPNGSQPYSSYYGSNYSYAYGRAYVTVNASSYSDVVVIVRYNNSNGRVAGHTYIRKGCSSTIYLPSERRYQVFFYYGKGWYPKKAMSGGVKGGFLSEESFSKDGESMYLDYGQGVTYTLTRQVNGNFSTSYSSESEMF